MGLHMPDIEVADEPRVQRVFEYYTENRVGRERFQAILFRCGAYRDLIQATLVRYEMPTALLAVVLTESGCEPLAKSPVGARGLWQFMPDAARAYHMRVIEDVIDERISPPKATEGGYSFLSDVYKKFGSWDLAFASYNMGPFGLLARIERAGGDVGFWDLVDAEMLPDETANYVPTIEAFALILENLQRLKFAGIPNENTGGDGGFRSPFGDSARTGGARRVDEHQSDTVAQPRHHRRFGSPISRGRYSPSRCPKTWCGKREIRCRP